MTALLETPRTTRRAAGRRLKQVLLGFWAMYFSIVAVSNAINLLDVFGVVHWPSWTRRTSSSCARS